MGQIRVWTSACENSLKGYRTGKGRLGIQAVRVAKNDYSYKYLSNDSLEERALDFDSELCNRKTSRPVTDRKTKTTYIPSPSLEAKKELVRECVVLFATNSWTGGSNFLQLEASCDFIIHYDAAAVLEPGILISLTSTRKYPSFERLHNVAIGDKFQRGAMYHTVYIVQEARLALKSDYQNQFSSMFERLSERERCHTSTLIQQYQMHPFLSVILSKAFYGGVNETPAHELQRNFFQTDYDQMQRRSVNLGYYPFTFMGTCMCRSRVEGESTKGDVTNDLEANLVERADARG